MTPATIPDDEPRRFEQDLLERTVLLESVLENLPSGLVVYDANLRLRMSNAAWRRMHDVPDALADAPDTTLEAILRCNAERGEYGPGDIDALVAERLRSNMHEGTIEFERTRPNGTVLRARSRKMPNGWYVKIFTDVTEERATLARLRASEERLALALETTGLGIWEYEVLADRVHLSDAWSRMFGYPPQLRAMTLGELNALAPPHRRAEIQQALLAVLKGQSSQFLLEHEMFDAQGRMLWVVTHARVAERNAQGRTVRMVGVTRDVTERHSQDDALRHAVDAANKANQAKADFLATMSHEIRTPINGVIGLARMLEDSPLAPQEAGYVRMINSCGNSLLALVNDVLDFSKIEAGQMVLEQIDTDLRELAHEMADVLASRAREKGVELIVRIAPEAPRRILADPHRLRQILLNLLGNALKFTASGAVTMRITAPLANGERRLRVDVTDTGIGIAADALPRLFRRFSQADASTTRRYQGTGLGLAISRDLAVLMGGDVTVTSTPGAGSTFTLDVPLRVAEQQHVCVAPPSSQRRPTGEMRVLLVEDNAINQMVALALLKKLGYTALTLAGDGEQALSLCAAECFDLVLMDCQMPVMNGFEATRRLRARGFAQPIVALTAGAVSQDREECLDAGMNDYVAKPIDSARLAATLERWLSVTA